MGQQLIDLYFVNKWSRYHAIFTTSYVNSARFSPAKAELGTHVQDAAIVSTKMLYKVQAHPVEIHSFDTCFTIIVLGTYWVGPIM